MAEALPGITGASLCNKCSALQINDQELGGYEAKNESGEYLLQFYDHRDKQLRLDYYHSDLLPDLLYLKASSEAGCTFCGALRDATLKLALDKPGHVTFMLHYVWGYTYAFSEGLYMLRADLTVNFDDVDSTDESNRRALIFLVDGEEGDCMRWLQIMQAPREQTLCVENIAWIKEELASCSLKCCPTPTSAFLPTRLLDLGTSDAGYRTRLIQTSDAHLQLPVRYTALSYCWGTQDDAAYQLKTTSSTLEQHLDNVSVDVMTCVIQDAVKTARALSIRYLWIDALCIIQDDDRDWRKESERMGLVYENAYVTICAISTSSCLDGFLTRSPPIRIAFQSALRPEIRGIYNLRPLPLLNKPLNDFDPLSLDVDCGAWVDRAWTFQELDLSTRLLSFGSSRIYVSCRKRDRIEPNHKRETTYFPRMSSYLQSDRHSQNLRQIYDDWSFSMHDYAHRQTTDRRDRFPAISGLAKMVAAETGDEYIAGLWAGDLLRGLLWKSLDKSWDQEAIFCGFPLAPSDAYICPSWSWAKHYAIQYERFTTGQNKSTSTEGELRSECRSIIPWCIPEDRDLNPYGQITDAGLRVEGKLVKVNRFCDRIRFSLWGYQQWKAKFNAFRFSICDLDWLVEEGVQHFHLEEVHMLLLASSIGGNWEKYGPILRTSAGDVSNVPSGQIYDNEDNKEPLEIPDAPMDTQMDVEMQLASGSYEDNQPSINSPHGRFSENLDYDSASEHENATKRNAWGLLIRRLDKQEKFVRIGRFQILAELGGVDAFEFCPFELVEIV
ncbi:HET-domain-containing protein [Cucurbitaria berberidis CBS 394.84]|uniref:HET-domain-containing protein n=1 Tax=Cucurbitaria berberidis CBS 394.84 TaxID=1168544 RepID=A0A9P4LAJ7_9PLEO|nr:HET-domain-containing protein [Cucurbitaria berberidis CBS 394.84]KAF1847583.1 HET-domain-containing protein [Cucurbitaria berberidis CBS 394.84]